MFSSTGKTHVVGFIDFKTRLDKLAGISDRRLHDIRRTVASGMASIGITLPVIERVVNHAGGSFAGIVGTYQRLSYNDEKRAARKRGRGSSRRSISRRTLLFRCGLNHDFETVLPADYSLLPLVQLSARFKQQIAPDSMTTT